MASVIKNFGVPNGDPRNAEGVVVLNNKSWHLRPEAAGALATVNTEYSRVFGADIPVNESMRSLETQIHFREAFEAGWGAPAATPGTSVHGWGLAVDIDILSDKQFSWLRDNLPRFGWWWAGQADGEPWHFEFDGRNISTDTINRYRVIGIEGDDMFNDNDRNNLQALVNGDRPLAKGYPFSHRDAQQNNLESIVTAQRAQEKRLERIEKLLAGLAAGK